MAVVADNYPRNKHVSINDHLHNHVHLTNCIHLKNHMHKHSPVLKERTLMRDLIALQRSRSLRDPSTSPPSWNSPLHLSLGTQFEREKASNNLSYQEEETDAASLRGVRYTGETSSGKKNMGSILHASGERAGKCNNEYKEKISYKQRKHVHTNHLKTLPEKKKEWDLHGEDAESSRAGGTKREKVNVDGHVQNKAKSRRLRCIRRPRILVGSKDVGTHKEMSMARSPVSHDYSMDKCKEKDEGFEVGETSRNVCGLPWNWSRIHHRGKSILDMAGRSFSCGLSDSRLPKSEIPLPQTQREVSDMTLASDHYSSQNSDSDVLPLLVESSTSHHSNEIEKWTARVSKSRHVGKHDLKSRVSNHDRHRSFTMKYTPKTFKDLVGQHLVAQALTNAAVRRKVSLVYVFYGPHGTGKTSCARIFARTLNCLSPRHPRPCGICHFCVSQDLGKSQNIVEMGPIENFDFKSIMFLLQNLKISQFQNQYGVLIVDDCDTLPPESWNAISKVIDHSPRHIVFVLVCTNLDYLPHIIVSRCQKFFFPKLKEADIRHTLQKIATKEGLEIDGEALKLIASRSDGSLRDAEMTLDQLSLLGQKISVPLVQELVGLVSDDKLVDLLDLALSADTVNTVKSLREIMEAGVEPLALMSQLATMITDILAGSYVFTRERLHRKFFRQPTLSKEDMEKLRQALRALSEAEKQLRMSNDRVTWLTAALLQLAPDCQYLLPSSSEESSLAHSPLPVGKSTIKGKHITSSRDLIQTGPRKNWAARGWSKSRNNVNEVQERIQGKVQKELEEIWWMAIENIRSKTLKQFLYKEGNLASISLGEAAAPTVKLMFTTPENRSKAELCKGHISQAFELVLGFPAIIKFELNSLEDSMDDTHPFLDAEVHPSKVQTHPKSVYSKRISKSEENNCADALSKVGLKKTSADTYSIGPLESEIVELNDSRDQVCNRDRSNEAERGKRSSEKTWAEEETSQRPSTSNYLYEEKNIREKPKCQSIVKGRVSLAHVIRQSEGGAHRNGWTKRKAISIAEKLEQENLRLEPKSRSFLCWNVCRITERKIPRIRIKTRRPCSLLKLIPCSRNLCAKTPR